MICCYCLTINTKLLVSSIHYLLEFSW